MIFKVSKLVLSLDFRKCSTIAHLLSDQGTHHKLGHINRKTLNLSNMNHGQPLLMIIRRRHSYGLYLLRWLWPLHNVAIAISEFISCICIALCLLCCGLPSVFFFFLSPPYRMSKTSGFVTRQGQGLLLQWMVLLSELPPGQPLPYSCSTAA